jgi:hypothetical protein
MNYNTSARLFFISVIQYIDKDLNLMLTLYFVKEYQSAMHNFSVASYNGCPHFVVASNAQIYKRLFFITKNLTKFEVRISVAGGTQCRNNQTVVLQVRIPLISNICTSYEFWLIVFTCKSLNILQ